MGGGGGSGGSQVPFQSRSLGACFPDNLQHLDVRNAIYNTLGIK